MTEFIPIPGHEDFLSKKVVVANAEGLMPYPGTKLSVHYTGALASNGTIFDSSVEHGEKFHFTLGAGEVIKGWDVGMGTMRVGEKAMLKIHPDYGYGATGAGEGIPPNVELIFEVEVFGFSGGVTEAIGTLWANTDIVNSGNLSSLELAQSVAAFTGCTAGLLKSFDSSITSGKNLVNTMLDKGQPESVQKLLERFQSKIEGSLNEQFNGKSISEKQSQQDDPVIGTVTIVGLVFPEGRKDLEQYEVFISYAGKGTLFKASSWIRDQSKTKLKRPLTVVPVLAKDFVENGGAGASSLASWAVGSFNKSFLEEEVFTKYWAEAANFPNRPEATDLAGLDIGSEADNVTPYIVTASSLITVGSMGRANHFCRESTTRNQLPRLY